MIVFEDVTGVCVILDMIRVKGPASVLFTPLYIFEKNRKAFQDIAVQ